MPITKHHCDIHDGEEVWYYEDSREPHVYVGRRGSPDETEGDAAE